MLLLTGVFPKTYFKIWNKARKIEKPLVGACAVLYNLVR